MRQRQDVRRIDRQSLRGGTGWLGKTLLYWVTLFFWLPAAPACSGSEPVHKTVILGVDGLDPKLLARFMGEGILPNFSGLVEQGDFRPLQTTMPPLSPVAWSTFITGQDAGGHGIFDFIHRDPETMAPQLSLSRAIAPTRKLEIGSWEVPLSRGRVEQLRKGQPFWQILEKKGISTTIFRIPANFPPQSQGKSLSGMGTPDLLGTPGTFSFYTDLPPADSESISGGRIYPVEVVENVVTAPLEGPENSFRKPEPDSDKHDSSPAHPLMTLDFHVYLDPEKPVAKFEVGGMEFVLSEGEWSDWVRIDFEAIPLLVEVSATARFYLQQVRPEFKLYVTPLQINPEDPAMPISTPSGWSRHLQRQLGYFYTQELPEDTKALSAGIFTPEEFWQQCQFVHREERKALEYLLDHFDQGLLFTYFSTVDQGSHMLWRDFDEKHPAFRPESPLKDAVRTLYRQIDDVLGMVLDRIESETTLIVMSDHGFSPFYKGVNLNSWLLQKGYVVLKDPSKQGELPLFLNVDWSRTQAYALGLNSIYVNLQGRERNGAVAPGSRYDELLEELEADLRNLEDPETGRKVVTLVIQARRDLEGEHKGEGPDLIVGYNWGYRSSWESPLGQFPRQIFVENTDAWSGDHSVDYRLVPGVLVSNRQITLQNPALSDLTVAVLDEYGVPGTAEMVGQDCLAGP